MPDPRLFFLTLSPRSAPSRELPPGWRGLEANSSAAVEVTPGVRVAPIGTGDFILPGGTTGWGSAVAVWAETGDSHPVQCALCGAVLARDELGSWVRRDAPERGAAVCGDDGEAQDHEPTLLDVPSHAALRLALAELAEARAALATLTGNGAPDATGELPAADLMMLIDVAYDPRLRSHASQVIRVLRLAPELPLSVLCGTCGKHRYATSKAAERIIVKSAMRREPGEKTETRAYYEHGWWHLTSREDHADDATGERQRASHPLTTRKFNR